MSREVWVQLLRLVTEHYSLLQPSSLPQPQCSTQDQAEEPDSSESLAPPNYYTPPEPLRTYHTNPPWSLGLDEETIWADLTPRLQRQLKQMLKGGEPKVMDTCLPFAQAGMSAQG